MTWPLSDNTILMCNAGSATLKLAACALTGKPLWERRLEGAPGTLEAGLREQLSASAEAPHAVLHRIVHAGAVQEFPSRMDESLLARIAHWAPLAPLHNPLALRLVAAVRERWPDVLQFAVFDSGLFGQLPEVAAVYALPATLSPRWPLRRYGFHGLAHRSQWRQVQPADGAPGPRRLITLQLGSGCSLTAWKDDQVLDTTMGFTPLEGLVMATRSGTLDPGIVLHLLQQEGMSAEQIRQCLMHEAGLAALAPGKGDMRALLASALPAAEQALAHYCWSIRKAIGAAVAVLGGLDALCIGGGVGENQPLVRARILQDLQVFGIALDTKINTQAPRAGRLQSATSQVVIALTPVNEMDEMFRQFAAITAQALESTHE
jgi:acetate kinase